MASMSAHALGMLQFALKHPGEWHSWDKKDRKTRNAVARLQVLGLIEAEGTQFRLAGDAKPVEPVGVVGRWAQAAVHATGFTEATMRGECWADLTLGVRLIQTGVDRFTVVYGKQVKSDLSYGDAARELGAAMMHALANDSMLDNREPRTRRDLRPSAARFANPDAS